VAVGEAQRSRIVFHCNLKHTDFLNVSSQITGLKQNSNKHYTHTSISTQIIKAVIGRSLVRPNLKGDKVHIH